MSDLVTHSRLIGELDATLVKAQKQIAELEGKLVDQQKTIDGLAWWRNAINICGVAVIVGIAVATGFEPTNIAREYIKANVPGEVVKLVSTTVADSVPPLLKESLPGEVSKLVPAEVERTVAAEVARFVPGEVERTVPAQVAKIIPDEIAKAVPIQVALQVKAAVPSAVQNALHERTADEMLKKLQAISSQAETYSNTIQGFLLTAQGGITALKESRQLEVDRLVAKEISIVARDGTTQIGRISSDRVSSYLVRPQREQVPSSLCFELGQNSQDGGSIVIRHPPEPGRLPFGVEIRAWNNEAAVLLVDDTGKRVGNKGSANLISGSLVWTKDN